MSYLRLANQHLSSVRIILDELDHRVETDAALQSAFHHSALSLLNSAYLCQLRAIAENYHCSDTSEINTIESLQTALVAIDKPAPEAQEIEVLVSEGWLSELLRAHQRLCLDETFQLPTTHTPRFVQSDIALHDEDGEQSPLSAPKLRQWKHTLEELVQRQSEMMTEY